MYTYPVELYLVVYVLWEIHVSCGTIINYGTVLCGIILWYGMSTNVYEVFTYCKLHMVLVVGFWCL